LTAQRQGGEIRICVEDDGRGFDQVKLAAVGGAPGRVGAESDNQVGDVLFQAFPGAPFPLAEQQTGREADGGLAGVSARLQDLRGTMELRSAPGKGALVTLRVPWDY